MLLWEVLGVLLLIAAALSIAVAFEWRAAGRRQREWLEGGPHVADSATDQAERVEPRLTADTLAR